MDVTFLLFLIFLVLRVVVWVWVVGFLGFLFYFIFICLGVIFCSGVVWGFFSLFYLRIRIISSNSSSSSSLLSQSGLFCLPLFSVLLESLILQFITMLGFGYFRLFIYFKI